MTQAIALREMLSRNGHEVVEVLIGKSPQREIPPFFLDRIKTPVSTFESPNFQTNAEDKQSAIYKSAALSLIYLRKYVKSIHFINDKINEWKADAVVNFYDLVAGITYALFKPETPMFCIAHQYLFLHPDYNFPPKRKQMVEALKIYTKLTCLGASRLLALSFTEKEDFPEKNLHIVPPLLRKELFEYPPQQGDFFLGYMLNSGFATEVKHWHKNHPEIPLRFFWDKKEAEDVTTVDDTLSFHKINDRLFLQYMSQCRAYATTGGFESVCEAIYYQKPVMMVPAHIEQECNAHEAQELGVGIASPEFNLGKLRDFIPRYKPDKTFESWLGCSEKRIISLLENIDDQQDMHKFIPEPIASALLKIQRFVVSSVTNI